MAALLRPLAMVVILAISHTLVLAQDPKMVRIGVIRSAAIPLLEINESGFEAALAGSGLKAGVNLSYDLQTIGSDPERAQVIIQKFVTDRVDLIHSIGTGPTRAALKAAGSVPVVFSAVTDPVGAGVVPANGSPGKPTGTNVTGISDGWPLALQLETYVKIVPRAKKWGTLYNPTDANSVQQVKVLQESALRLGLELVALPVNSPSEVRPAAFALTAQVQAIFLIADSTVGAEFAAVQEACTKSRIPRFSGVHSAVAHGALAAFGVDYFLAGYAAGKKAALVLRGVPPGQIPWATAENFGLVINRKAATELGIVIPADMLRIADKVVE